VGEVTDKPRGPVVYLIVCGCPVAREVGQLVALAQQTGWTPCVIASPDGSRFIDAPSLAKQTGFPVRTHYKQPGDPDLLPPPEALIAAPVSVNTVNKWAAGICDTLALGLLVEGIGLGQPIVTLPFTNRAHAAHPMFRENLARLKSWGVDVLFGEDIQPLHEPRAGHRHAPFPWRRLLETLETAYARSCSDDARLPDFVSH
jgi:hypothetical protein